MNTSNCKECEKEILWAETSEGKFMPLDVNSEKHIYGFQVNGRIVNSPGLYVSHFLTCSKPNKFSGKSKQKELFD